MTTNVENKNTGVRYQPDEKPPLALSSGLGIQLAILCISGVVLTPAIVVQAAGGGRILPDMGSLWGCSRQWHIDSSSGLSNRLYRGRLRLGNGDFRCVYCGLCHCHC